MRVRPWMVGVAALPAAVGVLGALAALALLPDMRLRFTTPLPVAISVAGLAISAIVVIALATVHLGRRARARASERGRAEGEEQQRQAHRRFLARLDHELKNPVTAIHAAVATEPGADGGALATIDAQARRLTTLVSELRKLADVETLPIEREPVDLEEVARDAVAAVSDQLRSSQNGEHRTFAIVFPQAPWPLPRLRGDVDLLFLALYNLVSNAAKFSAAGDHIEIRGREDDGWAVIEVADTGVGIPAGEESAVWDELARGANAHGVPGSGLGLSIVAAVASRHNGQVSLRSREGHGTSVRVRLPYEGGGLRSEV